MEGEREGGREGGKNDNDMRVHVHVLGSMREREGERC